MLVSALEKNAEQKISAARIENNKPSGASFKAVLDLGGGSDCHLEEKVDRGQVFRPALCVDLIALQDQLQYQLGSKKCQHE
jgi:hypothetical protein